jgi:TonB family protein
MKTIKLLLVVLAFTIVLAIFPSCKHKNSTPVTSEIVSDSIYVNVDELPVFLGGDIALLNFISTSVVYPEDAKKNNIQGRVIVKFVVKTDCTVSDVEVLKTVYPSIDQEAVRVVNLLKFETPAKKDGKAVQVFYMIPISFTLN